MNQLSLKTFPDQALRAKTERVTDFGDSLKDTIRKMSAIMYLYNGIGLAAPQTGLSKRLLITDVGEGLTAFINPEITSFSAEKDKMEEGCLSLPDTSVMVSRPEKVTVKAMNTEGKYFSGEYDGLMAKALQHEMDHLNGKLLIDYLNPIAKVLAEKRLKKAKVGNKARKEKAKSILI